MNDLVFIKSIDEIDYLSYKPTLTHLYFDCYSDDEKPPYFSRIVHHIRMTREMIFAKYQVIYMRKNDKIVGHLVVSRGGTRIAESTKDDIVIGPIWITPSQRGKGLGSKGINDVLHNLGFSYKYAYEYIEDTNVASIRTVEKNGFSSLGKCKEYGILKTIKPCESGNIILYRIKEFK